MRSTLSEEEKNEIIKDLNIKIGDNILNLAGAYDIEVHLAQKKEHLQSCLHIANDKVPTQLSTAIKKAEKNSKQIQNLKTKSEQLKEKVEDFIKRSEPLKIELDKRFSAISRLEGVLLYLKTFEKIDELCRQMKQCSDDEQLVQLYGELKAICSKNQKGHQAAYIKEYTHYWHNVLKDNLTKHYEDVLKALKWPFSSSENSTPAKEVLMKFTNITRYLFLIQEPEDIVSSNSLEDYSLEQNVSLPVRILLRPIKKRFMFHFTGSRQTARIDRPEWFLTQTLNWIKHNRTFIHDHVQPVADKLDVKGANTVDEFNNGVVSLAAERLHTVLGLYVSQGARGEVADADAAFAHAVDETLGFHRELVAVVGRECGEVVSVLTKAENLVRWLAVEKKYALLKMDEALGSEQWCEPVVSGVGVAVGDVLWVPRAADWFVALLKTIEDRYATLPQPGHRLQFLELQLELVEEWRVRLTQLMGAAMDALQPETFLTSSGPQPLTAVINAAHYTRAVLLQWAHSLHYLQLHFYRRQFDNFTHRQHKDEETEMASSTGESDDYENASKTDEELYENVSRSIDDLEMKSQMMAMREVCRRCSLQIQPSDVKSPLAENPSVPGERAEEGGVFSEAPELLALLCDAGLAALAEHILLEFKATIRDYKRLKWHAMPMVEEMALTVSGALCGPLSALCARISAATARLAPALAARVRAHVATDLDHYMLQEMVLETWFNTGGTLQFTHDVKRNLVPAFTPPNKSASKKNLFPKLAEACNLLNMDYEDARRLYQLLSKEASLGPDSLATMGVSHIQPSEVLRILSQRTDLGDSSTPSSVMELF